MKCVPLGLIVICSCLILAGPVQAQISFYQPMTVTDCSYAGNGGSKLFVADFNGDGMPDLLCSDGTLNLGNGDGTFKPGPSVPLVSPNQAPQGILAVADFNGDNKQDVLEEGTTGTFLVLPGNGDGTFGTAISSSVGVNLLPIAASDLNGDARPDIVGIYSGIIYVSLSNGDGTFKAGVPLSLGSLTVQNLLSLGDFNNDQKTDISLVALSGSSEELVVLLGNGDGTFRPAQTTAAPAGLSYYQVLGDFNGDGNLDVALAGECNGVAFCNAFPAVYLFLGNGDGTFEVPTTPISDSGPFAADDFNGDGKLDLVFADSFSVAKIYTGNGDGTFAAPQSYVSTLANNAAANANDATTLAVGDWNLDHKGDIVTAGGVLLGNGDGTFQGVPLANQGMPMSGVGGQPGPTLVGDFEKNGTPDVAMLSTIAKSIYSSTLYIFHNNGTDALTELNSYSLTQPSYAIAIADLNGDRNLDLVVISQDPTSNDWSYNVLLGNGDGSFQSPSLYAQSVTGGRSEVVQIADLNGDNKPDLVVGGVGSGLAVLLGNGDGTFGSPQYYVDFASPIGAALLIGDFNGDGKIDIAVPNGTYGQSGTVMLYGDGDGTFQPAVIPSDLSSFSASLTADLTNDGKSDLLDFNQIALNQGSGAFKFLNIPYGPQTVADFNGDGIPDLFVMNQSQTAVQLGNGDGTFGPLTNVPANGVLYSVQVTDMNGDGKPDLVFPWGPGMAVLFNSTSQGLNLMASTLSPSPVAAGGSATSTVTAMSNFGFNGTETLSCGGLPSGAGCTFNPVSISGRLKSTLTITTSSSTAAGTYTVQILGVAGSVTNTVTTSLVVQASPDFSIAAASGSPSSQTVSAGQTASFSLAFAGTGGFTGTVNLGCAITPAATPAPTCSIPSSVQISGTGTRTVTVKVGTTAPVTSVAAPQINFPSGPMLTLWTLIFLGSTALWMRNRKRLVVLATQIVLLAFAFSVGCGGSGSSSSTHTTPGTPAGTYTATVTATSGSTSHNMAIQVVVQ